MIKSVLLVAGADAASRVRYNNANVESYDVNHIGSVDLSKFLMSWNSTMGPPPRGWYKAEFFMQNQESNNLVIKKSGETGETKATFNFEAHPKEHYCKYRIDDTGENDECCDAEDQNCYTKAGCYCDKACFTVYGDCCTDHFVTCYDDLRLCLTKVAKPEDDLQADDPGALADALKGRHQRPKPRLDGMQNDWTGEVNPAHVEPNACCGQEEYNDSEKCCNSSGGTRKLGSIAKGECEEEEEEEGVDNRASLYDEETPDYEEE